MFVNIIFTLSITIVLLFIAHSFYTDYGNWSNTGNSFAEGLTNLSSNQIDILEKKCISSGCARPYSSNRNCKSVTVNNRQMRACGMVCQPSINKPDICRYDRDCSNCGNTFFDLNVGGLNNRGGFCPDDQDCGISKNLPVQIFKKRMPASMGYDQQSSNQPLVPPTTLFTKQLMTQVLANKNLIPSDINLKEEHQGNFIRVGKGFMNDVSHIRNLSLPTIDNDDYESLGRIIAKIKNQESDDTPQNQVTNHKLIKSVNNILSGSKLSNSQVDWETSKLTPKLKTTGMYGENSNSLMGYGDKATEKPEGGLCMWKGCDKSKNSPYDSIWSLY